MSIDSPQILRLGVLRETAPETRVALDPATVAVLVGRGDSVIVETGAGVAAGFSDASFTEAGATVADRAAVLAEARVVPFIDAPREDIPLVSSGTLLIGIASPAQDPEWCADLAARGVALASLDLLPRTLSRAQSMDALSSQSSAAGYAAVIIAARDFPRFLPMMITAAGTARPAGVLVIGTGVAGLQAIATARRLGAVVTGYDVRPASRGEVESLGARFATSTIQAAGAGGYARALTEAEATQQKIELDDLVTAADIVITTARVPGSAPPELVSAEALARMRRGSVCVDLAAGPQGGNVSGSVDGETHATDAGVTVVGASRAAGAVASAASEMYAHNVLAFLDIAVVGGVLVPRGSDEIVDAVTVCRDGTVAHPGIRELLGLAALDSPAPAQQEVAAS